jgi:hypothetical protein
MMKAEHVERDDYPCYLPTKRPMAKAAAANNPWNCEFDFGLPTSANFKARSVSFFSFSEET